MRPVDLCQNAFASPDSAGGAYSAPQTPIAGFEGGEGKRKGLGVKREQNGNERRVGKWESAKGEGELNFWGLRHWRHW